MKQLLSATFIMASLLAAFAIQATAINQPAQLVKDTHLLKAPKAKAEKLASMDKNQKVTIQQRQRAWYQVLTEDKSTGWLKMLEVRFLEFTKKEGQSGLKKLWNSVTAGKTDTTVSTGVRGFDEEDLKKATAAPKQVEQLASYSVDKKQAKAFAKQGGIKAFKLDIQEGE